MKQSGQLEKEENAFLSVCSLHDRDLLTGKADMTLEDFERITYLTMAMDYIRYTQSLHARYTDLSAELSGKFGREGEILEEYSEYYQDEQVCDTCQKWIDDFCKQIPADKREYYLKKLNGY